MRRRLVSLSVVALALLAGCDRTDRDFGQDGVSRFGFEPTDAVHRAGSTGFVATGQLPDTNRTAVAAFGSDGKVRWQVALPTSFHAVEPVATFAGTAVNVVATTAGRLEVAQVRNGALVDSYGEDGIASTEIEIGQGTRPAALTDSRGRTVVVGQRDDSMVYARIGTSGAVDREVDITLARSHPVFVDAVMADDDKVVVTYARFFNRSDGSEGSDLVVTRLLPTGTLDRTFSGDGITTIPSSGYLSPSSILLRPDGRIVVAGATDAGELVLIGLTADGEPDPGFGTYGLTVVDEPFGATAMTLGGPGLLVTGDAGGGDIVTRGFDAAGKPDDTWGDGGRQVHDLGGNATAADVVQLSARALVLASTADDPGGALLAVK